MTNNGNMPAMPCEVVEQYHIDQSQVPCGAPTLRERKVMSGGMTKREMMAMHMMASMSGIHWEAEDMYDSGESLIKCQAQSAVEMADALLAELGRTK